MALGPSDGLQKSSYQRNSLLGVVTHPGGIKPNLPACLSTGGEKRLKFTARSPECPEMITLEIKGGSDHEYVPYYAFLPRTYWQERNRHKDILLGQPSAKRSQLHE